MQLHLSDTTMSYDDLGAGVPVICLSPFPFAGYIWREQAPLQDAARLIIPDYRGIGQSGETQCPSTMERLADDVVALLDHLQLDTAVVMGVSMGCYVAFALYAKYPQRVRALVLADSRAEADGAQTLERRKATVEGLRSEGAGYLQTRVDNLFAATTHTERPQLVAEMREKATAERAEGLALITLGMAARPDSTPLLPHIAVPTLVICGEEDTVSPCEGMMAMANAIPGAHYAEIPAAGHLSPLEQPERFNTLVREFLAEVG